MNTESSDNRTRDPGEEGAATAERSRTRDIRAEVAAQREKIREDLRALRQDLRILEIPEFVRQHPVAATAGAGLVGFLVSRILSGDSGRGHDKAADDELLDELLETIVEDAAHRVSAGAETREALRTTLREHGPIVFEVERAEESTGRGVAGTVSHVAFDLAEPYLRGLIMGWLEDRMSPREK